MKKYISCVSCVLLAWAFNSAPIWAFSEQSAERAAEHETEYDEKETAREMEGHIEGKVVRINPDSKKIAIDEEDTFGSDDYNQTDGEEDADNDAIFVYRVKPDTTFTGASSIKDINCGDVLSVDYYIFKDHRVAAGIVVEKRAYKKESPPPSLGVLRSKY